jgi:hypothetical protein
MKFSFIVDVDLNGMFPNADSARKRSICSDSMSIVLESLPRLGYEGCTSATFTLNRYGTGHMWIGYHVTLDFPSLEKHNCVSGEEEFIRSEIRFQLLRRLREGSSLTVQRDFARSHEVFGQDL